MPEERRYSPPDPLYEVRVEESVFVAMRDGVRLSTDLYFPVGVAGPLAVVLIRTPYNKFSHRAEGSDARIFAGQGYAVAVQDMRGKFESEGDYTVSAADRADGDDAVIWLAAQPWSNGKVGTYGCSYLGENQLQLAAMRNPRHTCMLPKAAAGATRYFGVISGGAIDLLTTVEWFRVAGAKVHPQYLPGITTEELRRAAPYYRLAPSLPEIDRDAIVRSLPVIEQLQKAGAPPSDFEGFVSHAPGDPWWEQFGYVDARDRFDVPALLLDSWNDYGVADTLRFFNLLGSNSESARGRDNRFVVIGPGTHCSFERASEHTMAGERDLGDARFDYDGLYLRWFDHWLRGAGDGAFDLPRVTYYVMGSGAWKTAGDWPIPGTRFTDWYLHSGGRANSRFGDGTLSGDAPGDEPPDRFTYDPATPVPRLGGPVGVGGVPAGSFDQREIETRHDVLVYTSVALAEGIEVTGPLELVLYVSSSARDTDFTARLIDVYPDGRAYNVQEGILRARYRAGYGRTVWLAPDEVVELRIDLQATSNFFGPGHRVRLEVSSSNFPRWDRNLNTGGNNFDETAWVVAHNTVHHSARYPSRLVLPIVE